MLRDAALFLHQVEEGRGADILLFDAGAAAFLQAAGDVLIEAAAGDVGDALDIHLFQHFQHRLDVDLGGGQQGLAQGLAGELGRGGLEDIGVAVDVKDLAHQREAVGVDARGGQRQNDITGLHGVVVQDLFFVHNAHGETGQIVLLLRHHARVLGGLAAHQRAIGLHAALGHALDDLCDLFRDVAAAGDVIQEDQRLCTSADDIVDAHGHAVNADGVVLVHEDGQLDLGAAAVGAGNQHRLFHAGGQTKAAAEAAYVVQAALVAGSGYMLFHQLHRPVAGGDVHAGGGVAGGEGILVIHNAAPFLLITENILLLMIDYFRKKNFYTSLIQKLEELDKKYLILEMMSRPSFYEGKILYDTIYETDKSMIENVNEYLSNIEDFKDYIEMWIHEVKIPISSLVLMSHNHKELNNTYINEVKKLNDYVDQVLYYVRSNYAENDYIIKENNLDKIIKDVILKNKDELLLNNINIETNIKENKVLTDSKWLGFILNQIINNSIKYKKDNDSIIKIESLKENDKTILSIYDNGIGINKKDIKNVFKKSFTGENGRNLSKSTGMGLYIAKRLCDKLGHKILIESEKNEYTIVKIIFGNNDYYKIDN
mgnify:CR=1 FL=1